MAGTGNTQSDDVRLTARVHGVVQGVGFRYWTARQADGLALTGTASNLDDGSVEIVAEGTHAAAEELLDWLRSGEAPGRVREVEATFSPSSGSFKSFRAR